MKTKRLLEMLLQFICLWSLAGCVNDDDPGRKVTDYKEYTLIVASEKLQGIVFSCGNSVLAEVLAVREEGSRQWRQMSGISGFEYECGYEYKIRIGETHYLDYRMGEPAWTEYRLLRMISKEKKESKDLPESFVPDCSE